GDAGRALRVVGGPGGEFPQQRRLDREHRVAVDVLAPPVKDVRGHRAVAGCAHDHVDVRGPPRPSPAPSSALPASCAPPAGTRLARASTSIDTPSVSDHRIHSWRLPLVMWPVAVNTSIAARHSSSVSPTSLTNACR